MRRRVAMIKLQRWIVVLGSCICLLCLTYTVFYPEGKLLKAAMKRRKKKENLNEGDPEANSDSDKKDDKNGYNEDEDNLSKCRIWISAPSPLQMMPNKGKFFSVHFVPKFIITKWN